MKDSLRYLIAGIGTFAILAYIARSSRSSAATPTVQSSNNSMYPNPLYTVRGYRNNNPLNIVYSAKNDWAGQIVPSTDSRFAQFVNMAYGYRAAFRTLRTYINSYGANTLRKIIERWAPPSENDTNSYLTTVANYSGVVPDATLSETDTRLKKVVEAMSIVENGSSVSVPIDSLNQGWNLYLQSI